MGTIAIVHTSPARGFPAYMEVLNAVCFPCLSADCSSLSLPCPEISCNCILPPACFSNPPASNHLLQHGALWPFRKPLLQIFPPALVCSGRMFFKKKYFLFLHAFEGLLLWLTFSGSAAPYYLLQCDQREPFKISFPPPSPEAKKSFRPAAILKFICHSLSTLIYQWPHSLWTLFVCQEHI